MDTQMEVCYSSEGADIFSQVKAWILSGTIRSFLWKGDNDCKLNKQKTNYTKNGQNLQPPTHSTVIWSEQMTNWHFLFQQQIVSNRKIYINVT